LAAPLAIGLQACWISSEELDERYAELTDGDGDGYPGLEYGGDDCDDGDAAIHPAASESCDGIDNDCDGQTDEDLLSVFYQDADGDGFGDADSAELVCEASSGWVVDGTDCDDGDSAINPEADEYCDGVDNDCDGETDDESAMDVGTWYADGDGDGYGDLATWVVSCDQPADHVADASDCDDTDAATSPEGEELCDGIDNDCDDEIDEDDASDAREWFADEDGDGYGDPDNGVFACEAPKGYGTDNSDCDDDNGEVYPGGLESIEDEVDGDCDGGDDSFEFLTMDARSSSSVQGPRLVTAGDTIYLAWAAESLEDGGTLYDALGVSIFDADDLLAGEDDFWSDGSKSNDGILGRFDFVADTELWVAGRSFISGNTRWIQLDAVEAASLAAGSYVSEQEWPIAFDTLQLALSSGGSVTAVGCGASDAGMHAMRLYASYVAAGVPYVYYDSFVSILNHGVCEPDHTYAYNNEYIIYASSSDVGALYYYYYDHDLGAISQPSYSPQAGSWYAIDIERAESNSYELIALANNNSSAELYLDQDDESEDGYVHADWKETLIDVDVAASPGSKSDHGQTYACAVGESGSAWLLYAPVIQYTDGSGTLQSLELSSDLGAIDDCAITVSSDSVAMIALRSGDDIAYGLVGVP